MGWLRKPFTVVPVRSDGRLWKAAVSGWFMGENIKAIWITPLCGSSTSDWQLARRRRSPESSP